MRIVGLDIASRLTGWCCGDGQTVPRADAFRFQQYEDDLGALLDAFDRSLCVLFDTEKPDAAVFEAPILIINKKKRGDQWRTTSHVAGPEEDVGGYSDTPLKLRKLYSMSAYFEFFCRRRGIECSEVSIQAIKKEVTGDRHADKEVLVAVARNAGMQLPTGPAAKDAADAWGAWLLGLRHYDRATSRTWDARVFKAGARIGKEPHLL